MRGFRRAQLTATRRKKKGGGFYWAARGWVPVRNPDGSYDRRRIERSLEGDTAAERQTSLERIAEEYEERAQHRPLSFARAYLNYTEHNEVPLYGEKILLLLGEYQCREISDTMMVVLSQHMFKEDAAPSYINRHLYTPVIAILNMGLKNEAPRLTRPKGHKDSPAVVIPPSDWYGKILPYMPPHSRAALVFLTMHGRRTADALGRVPKDFDPKEKTLMVGKTKNGDPLLIDLHPGCVELFLAMPGWKDRQWLFRDGPESDSNFRRDILIACLRASGYEAKKALQIAVKPTDHADIIANLPVPYYPPHAAGRHAFATRMLRAGYSLQYVKDAGGWKTIEVLSRLYGHLERKDYVPGVHRVADNFMDAMTSNPGGNVGGALPAPHAISPVKSGESYAIGD